MHSCFVRKYKVTNYDLKKHLCACLCVLQFTREAHFAGEGYLGLNLDNVPDVSDNFYAGIGFRTDQQNGLMFYHQGQVQTHNYKNCIK